MHAATDVLLICEQRLALCSVQLNVYDTATARGLTVDSVPAGNARHV